jgi:hypothetical protein
MPSIVSQIDKSESDARPSQLFTSETATRDRVPLDWIEGCTLELNSLQRERAIAPAATAFASTARAHVARVAMALPGVCASVRRAGAFRTSRFRKHMKVAPQRGRVEVCAPHWLE